MAPRLRIEPYDNDAIDGDNDGIVQEGTAFERPAGTRLVDAAGRAISNGITATQRAQDIRVVDRDGNTVPYTPSYGTVRAAAPDKPAGATRSALGATLGERYGTLGDKNPNLGARLGTLSDRSTPKRPDVTVNTPDITPDVTPDRTPDATPGTPEAIRQKNERVINKIQESGGNFNFRSLTHTERQEFLQKQPSTSFYAEEANGRDRIASRRTKVTSDINEQINIIQSTIDRGTLGPDDQKRQQDRISQLQRQKQFLEDHTDEEIAQQIADMVREALEDDETRVAVQIPSGPRFDSFLTDGYKTTHEVQSGHSDATSRRAYEATQGIPADAPAEVRPASGYMRFGSRVKASRERNSEPGKSAEHTAEYLQDTAGSTYGTYGDIQVILKPEVADRTRFGMGDSFNSGVRSGRLTGATDDELLDAVLATDGGKGALSGADAKRLDALTMMLANGGDPAQLGQRNVTRDPITSALTPEGDNSILNGEYFEALVFGSFDINDVEEIVIPNSMWTAGPITDRKAVEYLTETIRNNPELLSDIPMDDLQYFTERLQANPRLVDEMRGLQIERAVTNLIERQKRQQIRDQIAARNPAVKLTFNGNGIDYDNPTAIGQPANTDIDQLFKRLLNERTTQYIAKLRETPDTPAPVIEYTDDDL